MSDDHNRPGAGRAPGRFLGSLREALANASKDDTIRQAAPSEPTPKPAAEPPRALQPIEQDDDHDRPVAEATTQLIRPQGVPSAAEAARAARGGTPNIPPVDKHVEFDAPPTTRVVRAEPPPIPEPEEPARTQLVRGKQAVKRGKFHQDPVVGWLVIVGGMGLGAYRAIYEGNNTMGRSSTQRIAIDFGDEAISSEEQAYIRYDSADRSFLFVPNLAKTNVVSVNDKRPTAAVPLSAMDVITMGRTQLVFVPFCGAEFDWSELPETKD